MELELALRIFSFIVIATYVNVSCLELHLVVKGIISMKNALEKMSEGAALSSTQIIRIRLLYQTAKHLAQKVRWDCFVIPISQTALGK